MIVLSELICSTSVCTCRKFYHDDSSASSVVLAGIRTNISGKLRSSCSSPKEESFTHINTIFKENLPVARLIARNTLSQFASTSAIPTSIHVSSENILCVPLARQCNFDSRFSICKANPAERSRNCVRLSNSACFSAIREVRM